MLVLPQLTRTAAVVGGHGGAVGAICWRIFTYGAMGKFLSALVFFLLSVFAFLFAFGIEPKVLLALTDISARLKNPVKTTKKTLAT
jgi:hypothetical protein